MKSRVVGGGYLDFITFELRKAGGDDYEKFQAILHTAPPPGEAAVPKVLMCRPELGFAAKRTICFMVRALCFTRLYIAWIVYGPYELS